MSEHFISLGSTLPFSISSQKLRGDTCPDFPDGTPSTLIINIPKNHKNFKRKVFWETSIKSNSPLASMTVDANGLTQN